MFGDKGDYPEEDAIIEVRRKEPPIFIISSTVETRSPSLLFLFSFHFHFIPRSISRNTVTFFLPDLASKICPVEGQRSLNSFSHVTVQQFASLIALFFFFFYLSYPVPQTLSAISGNEPVNCEARFYQFNFLIFRVCLLHSHRTRRREFSKPEE